ncbi:hypothetical protein RRG08_037644 [Elysia crispata]|uniref:Uncharacterized protein n=1 Tax=Elysia crispata TaxID=231223 RepID=A0AAE0YHD7_9GAST|nr:hypothetical protein RRG08_037644 [Elysia crispata]
MKSRCPTMVSIGTQTQEDFYCYNRPPTPPPGFYPIPLATGEHPGLSPILNASGWRYSKPGARVRLFVLELNWASRDLVNSSVICPGTMDRGSDRFIILLFRVEPVKPARKHYRLEVC